ncbi:hypothetical protein CBR_g3328 [Chara braunii]|uniref:Ubiquitin carboxyl-terminal hydrolase n=1 Tax=Chara braunii TaxID=69332 RepID=A0A388KFF7_CHABU|nr:hypothetical protein CBR_g3328 [Chara braunii]|eukprot:GBG68788.1 hypothetical protein CBR_g3328 [Chara braunii]
MEVDRRSESSEKRAVSSLKVHVKWGKELLRDVEIDTTQPPLMFKMQLYSLTGVPPERQKISVKGGLLQDEGDWSKLGVKSGQRLMMMGTAEEIPSAPKQGPVFVEDLPEEDREGASMSEFSAGLINLGNTCYMNSTVQCLNRVPELREALLGYSSASGIEQDASHRLALSLKNLFGELNKSLRPVNPWQFLTILRERFPQFAQTGENTFMQQDAEECWTQLLQALSQRLRLQKEGRVESVVQDLFGIEMQNRLKCQESGEESFEKETIFTFKCHISQETKDLYEGMKQSLKGEVEKNSAILGRQALFVKTSSVIRLPLYLTVQFVRFFWKREAQQKAKILKKVTWPMVLDLSDFCTDELQETLKPLQKAMKQEADEKAAKKEEVGGGSKDKGVPKGDDEKTDDLPEHTAEGAGARDTVMTENQPSEGGSSDGDRGGLLASTSMPVSMLHRQPTGLYDLVAVLTHKGRSVDSGHYVAWVKQESGSWIKFDDDKPSVMTEEEIMKLSGGGDWHMAYLCLYKARTVARSS